MVVAHNLLAMNANRQFYINTNLKAKSTEKLSSGYKINRAADDAAGLSISEKMRWQIRGLNRGSKNIQDGISLMQVADGALNEVHSMVHRIRELAIQSANGTNSDQDREYIQAEVKQIKKEISRTLNTTDFNGMEIFKAPYMLGVSGEPNDIKMFNTSESYSVSARGGLIFDNRRYTWGELGASVSNGVFTEDFAYKATGAGGETIDLSAKKGDSVNDVIRYYQVTSDTEGIYVNGKAAARWEGTAASGKWAGISQVDFDDNTYSFNYNGVDISFTIEDGDDMDTIISKLNPDNLSSERTMYYTAERISGTGELAVVSDVSITPMILDVTNGNKSDISNYSYEVSADETGVTIKQTIGNDSITHKKIAWSQFKDVATGDYPFSDWGLTDEGSNPQTFSSKATYEYKDDTTSDMETAISFRFTVKDEASRDGVIRGLNGITLNSGNVVAPLKSGGTSSNDNITFDLHSGLNSFEFERDVLARTFNDEPTIDTIKGTVVRTRNYDGTVNSYIQTHTMEQVYVKNTGNDSYELYTSQSADSDAYEKSDSGSLVVYKKSGDNYEATSSTLYEEDNNGTAIGNDNDHTKYAVASGDTQKYIITEDTWSVDKIYKLFTNEYDYKNTNGEVTMEATGPQQHIDMRTGVKDWKGRDVDTSSYGTTSTFTITNNGGSTSTYSTQFANESISLRYNGSGYTNARIDLTYNNANDSADGTGLINSSTNTEITPTDEATRTFTKSKVYRGSSYRTEFNSVSPPPPKKILHIQAGSQADNGIDLEWYGMSLSTIGLGGANVTTADKAKSTITMCDTAIETVSEARSTFGAYQNRLEHSFNVNSFTAENLDASESRIRDTDMAEEMVRYTKQNILEQAVMSMLSQANQNAQGVLSILAG